MAGNLGKLVAGGRQIAAGKGGMLQPRPLVAGDGAGDLRRPALRNIQRQTDIALRAAHRQAAHQSIRVRQRLLMLKGKPNTVRKNITQLSRLSASIPSAR